MSGLDSLIEYQGFYDYINHFISGIVLIIGIEITYGSHPLYKVRMRSLCRGLILLIVTQRSVQLFRVSISSRKPKTPECESVREFYLFTIHFSLFTDFAFPARDF